MAAGFKEFFDLLSPKSILLIFADMHRSRRKYANEFGEDLEKLLNKVARYIVTVCRPDIQEIAGDIENGKLQTYEEVTEALGLMSEEETRKRLMEELQKEVDRARQHDVEVDRAKLERERWERGMKQKYWEQEAKKDESQMLDELRKNQDPNIFDKLFD